MFNNSMFTGNSTFSLSGILEGLNKSLNVINKALPIYEEAKPIVSNIKSTITNFTKNKPLDNIEVKEIDPKKEVVTNSPTFFQ